MKLGKQISGGHKCPVCKRFGVEYLKRAMPLAGGDEIIEYEMFLCENCYAEFEVVKE